MNTINLKAQPRELLGRKTKNLRLQGEIPANVYGKNVDSQAITVKALEFVPAYNQAGETGLIELAVGSDTKHVLISEVQVNPVTDEMLHVNFREVSLKEKVEAAVPVEIVGESPAETGNLGTLVVQLSEIDVEALPTDLPEKFLVDVTTLTEVDQAIYVKDLAYDKDKVEILGDLEAIVVKVEPPQKEEVVVAPVTPIEGEAATTPTEGEAGVVSEETDAEKPAEE